MSKLFRVSCSVLVLFLFSLAASAQLSTATVFGTVTDATGAAIPGATIIVTQVDTNTTRTLTSKSDGSYRADFLPVGAYKFKVNAPGFKTLDRDGITLTVTQEAKLDFPLSAGGSAEIVEVTGEIPLLNTGNSVLGRTVDNVEIDNLPLVDRNVYALLDLTPGVQNNNAGGSTANGGVINPLGFPEQHVKINGSTDSATGQISYYLDGGSNMTGLRNTGNPLPNPDAIRELHVETNNLSAQFGRSSGGVVTVLTKSGTNSIHGSLFEFYRTRNFNATEHLFSAKVPYNQHRFGGTVGGPIKRDKIFFFGSFGGFRYISYNSLLTAVPSAAMRMGDFSENLPTTGQTGTTACGSTATAATSTKFYVCKPVAFPATTGARTAYAGNIVPLADFDPTILKLIQSGIIPLPNPSQPGDTAYTRRDAQRFTTNTDEYLGKGDIQLTAKQRVTLSYFHQTGVSNLNPSGNTIANYTTHTYNFVQHNANAQHVWTLSNNTVNQLYLGYTRLLGGRLASPATSLAAYGSKFAEQLADGTICDASPRPGCSMPQITVAGWFTAGQQITGPVTGNNVYLSRDVVSTTHGKHTFFYGGEANLEKDAQQTLLNNYGTFAFSQAAANTPTRTSGAITDFFFGRPATMNQDIPVYANANYWNFGAFFQDDFRILPSLTLNLGVRYDIQTAPLDTQRRTLNFKPGVQSTVFPSAPLGVAFVGDAGVPEGGAKTRYGHVSPRIGFAWTPYPDGRTVVHAGGGIFYGTVGGNLFEFPSNGLPFSGRPQFSKVISVQDPYTTDPSEFCPTALTTAGVCPNGTGVSPYPYVYSATNAKFIVRPTPIIAFDPNFNWPEIYQFNLGVQQQLTKSFAFAASYVGSLSRKLPIFNDINYPLYNVTAAGLSGPSCATTNTTQNCAYTNTTANLNARRPLNNPGPNAAAGTTAASPQYSTVQVIGSTEGANYHGLQITAEQRLTRGFSIKGFYVWSKSLQSEDLDTTGNAGNSAGSAPQDNTLKALDKQRSEFDQRHVAVISFVYKPKYNIHNFAFRNAINGWTVTALARMQSGNPFNITTGADTNQDGLNNDRPNLSGNGFAQLNDTGGSRAAAISGVGWVSAAPFCTFQPASGACPGAGPAGSDGVFRAYSLDGPGRRAIDASVFRDFHIYERVKFQLRGESTNVFNLTNLPNPTSTLSSATGFGKIPGTIQFGQFSNRIIAVGGRILF